MKYLSLLFMLMIGHCYAQRLKGTVLNADSRMPVANALVTLGSNHSYTDSFGQFSIDNSGADTLVISHMAYKTYRGVVSKAIANLRIMLDPAPIGLEEVDIHAHRSELYKKDSIANRQFYDKQFNYTGPKVMDAFTGNAYNRQPGELISINPLLLIQALTKKGTPEYKFHKTLLRDEQAEYISQKFNRGLVVRVTGLKGDSLSAFLIQYRPDYKFAHKATDYDIEVYVKDCYKKFLKEGIKGGLFRRKD